MEEIWKPVRGYEGWYEVSNLGRVRSIDRLIECKDGSKRFYEGKMLVLNENKARHGYIMVVLRRNTTRKTRWVHRLVLEAFNPVDNMENLQVGHKDEDVKNNRLDNLYWTTAKENSNYGSHNIKLSRARGGRPVQQFTMDGELVAEYDYASIAVKKYNNHHIISVLTGKRKSSCGYLWRYKNV